MKRYLVIFAVAALFGAATACNSASRAPKKDISLQLYSLRSVIGRSGNVSADFPEIMKKIGKMGYTGVEAAAYKDGKIYDREPAEYRAQIEAAGMKSVSTHVSRYLTEDELKSGDFSAALEWWKECIAAHKEAGCEYIVTPSMPRKPDQATMDLYCRYYNEVGRLCRERGIKYGYHNHAYEFQHKIGDTLMYDYLAEHTDPSLVFLQMDVYWAVIGDASPVDYFKKYPGRFKSLHIKDHREIGRSGMVGFDAIFRNIALAGTEFIVVELEKSDNPDIIEGVRESLDYLLKADFVPKKY